MLDWMERNWANGTELFKSELVEKMWRDKFKALKRFFLKFSFIFDFFSAFHSCFQFISHFPTNFLLFLSFSFQFSSRPIRYVAPPRALLQSIGDVIRSRHGLQRERLHLYTASLMLTAVCISDLRRHNCYIRFECGQTLWCLKNDSQAQK